MATSINPEVESAYSTRPLSSPAISTYQLWTLAAEPVNRKD
ncbi:hypothetical protein ACL1BM_08975 [Corynebacterium striatum]